MKILFVHPGCLMYSELYLRLEPLGLEIVAAAAQRAGHEARLLDLQIFRRRDFLRELDQWRPDAVAFSLNYLANIPEVVDLAKAARERLPRAFIFCGGHSATFTAAEVLRHAAGAMDCVVRGEGEGILPRLLAAAEAGEALERLPGVVTPAGAGPAPRMVESIEDLAPARELTRRRSKYFIGALDPCGCVEFARGCPWDCSFCSAWTFYNRSYRTVSPARAADMVAAVPEPCVFVVDDVVFLQPGQGMAIGREIERRGIRKQYYMETRADVLLKNKEVFRYWRRLGLRYMFMGLEAIDEEGLKSHRKRVSLANNVAALEFARSLDINVAVNIISDPDWDERRFESIRDWASRIPEIVHMTVNTPYPGTETWMTESRPLSTRDYRLFDVQHAVFPTRLKLDRFYEELVRTQAVLNQKHLGLGAARKALSTAAGRLAHGQTNFVKMLWKFGQVYNPRRQFSDHSRRAEYEMDPPTAVLPGISVREQLYVHERRPAAA